MPDLFAGCTLPRLPSGKALAAVKFAEFAPRAPLPSLATLARARKQASSWPTLSMVAPRETWLTPRGPLRAGPELDAGIDWLLRAADIVSAFAIVLATGAELTTGERDRELITAFVERLRGSGRTLVFAPRGLWEPEHAEPFATQLGAIYGFDPLEHDAPEGAVRYARVRPMGARPRLTEGHLTQIAERMMGVERAYVAIESEQCVREVKRLTRLFAELDEAGALEGDEELDEDDDELDEDDDDEAASEEDDASDEDT